MCVCGVVCVWCGVVCVCVCACTDTYVFVSKSEGILPCSQSAGTGLATHSIS